MMVQERNHGAWIGEEAMGIEGCSESGMGSTTQLLRYGVQERALE